MSPALLSFLSFYHFSESCTIIFSAPSSSFSKTTGIIWIHLLLVAPFAWRSDFLFITHGHLSLREWKSLLMIMMYSHNKRFRWKALQSCSHDCYLFASNAAQHTFFWFIDKLSKKFILLFLQLSSCCQIKGWCCLFKQIVTKELLDFHSPCIVVSLYNKIWREGWEKVSCL